MESHRIRHLWACIHTCPKVTEQTENKQLVSDPKPFFFSYWRRAGLGTPLFLESLAPVVLGFGGTVAVCERGQVVRVGTRYSHLKTAASPALLLCTQLYPALEERPLIFAGCQRASHIAWYSNFTGAAEDETNDKVLVILVRGSLSHLPASQGWMPQEQDRRVTWQLS